MSSKWLHWIILGLLFLALAAAPTPAQSAAGEVVVRIPVTGDATADRAAFSASSQLAGQSARVIDYGSFLWVVTDSAGLANLDASGASYQTIENPYTLSLGGQSFDPLAGIPAFGLDREAKTRAASGAGLQLVQFHGPTKSAWLDDLERAGLEVIQYIHPYTYLVWGSLDSLSRSQAQDAVRWAGEFLPAFALTPKNTTLSPDPLLVRVLILPQAGLETTLASIETLGGQILSTDAESDPSFDLATVLIPGDQLSAVARLASTYAVQPVPLDGGDRGEVSNQVNVNNVNSGNLAFPGYLSWLASVGLSGEGVIIANVDSGIDQTHPDLVNRMLPCAGTTCGGSTASDHGTHTAGIMAGDGTSGVLDVNGFLRGLGMAPGANLVEQVYAPTYLAANGMLTLMTDSVRNEAVISGNSWGPSSYPLGYDEDTRLVDIGVRDADPVASGDQPLSYILSIMNGNGGTSTQGTPDEAKNIFTIGATYLQYGDGDQMTNINDLAFVSAHGPALDGRIIPHLVAPGCEVDSTTYPGGGWELKCGTSMASPQVTGSVALFYEKYRDLYGVDPSPALVKAAFLPVAHDLAGYRDADGLIMGHPFNSQQGWGRLDTAAVVNPDRFTTVLYFDQEALLDETGEFWSYTLENLESPYSIRAMLVWTDAPGPGLGGTTESWVNNLDLTATIGASTYLGNNFDDHGLSTMGGAADEKNNTEGIFLSGQTASSVTFTVTAAQIAGDGVPSLGDGTDQDFALVIYVRQWTEYYFPLFTH